MKAEGVRRMKDEGGRMKERQVNEAPAFTHYFPFPIRHFSFFISYTSSFILQPSSPRQPSSILS
jgi:hypothetical protein